MKAPKLEDSCIIYEIAGNEHAYHVKHTMAALLTNPIGEGEERYLSDDILVSSFTRLRYVNNHT
jgi:hypothetical protein